jgi:hypothetical protein
VDNSTPIQMRLEKPANWLNNNNLYSLQPSPSGAKDYIIKKDVQKPKTKTKTKTKTKKNLVG